MFGGAASPGAVEALITELNHGSKTANGFLTLFQNVKSKNKGRREHITKDALSENLLSQRSSKRSTRKPIA
jgi:hypothetical protein